MKLMKRLLMTTALVAIGGIALATETVTTTVDTNTTAATSVSIDENGVAITGETTTTTTTTTSGTNTVGWVADRVLSYGWEEMFIKNLDGSWSGVNAQNGVELENEAALTNWLTENGGGIRVAGNPGTTTHYSNSEVDIDTETNTVDLTTQSELDEATTETYEFTAHNNYIAALVEEDGGLQYITDEDVQKFLSETGATSVDQLSWDGTTLTVTVTVR